MEKSNVQMDVETSVDEKTFAQRLAEKANQSRLKQKQERYDSNNVLFDELLKTYDSKIRSSLENSASKGFHKTYMNFDKGDFEKFDHMSHQTACILMLSRWKKLNPELKDLKFTVWKNDKFTVVFEF